MIGKCLEECLDMMVQECPKSSRSVEEMICLCFWRDVLMGLLVLGMMLFTQH